jgi:transposase-like protein
MTQGGRMLAEQGNPNGTVWFGSSAPAGCRYPREVIAVAVRWYLRYGLSYGDVEELLGGRRRGTHA